MHYLVKSSQHGLAHTRKLWFDFRREILPKGTKLVSWRAWSANHVYIISICVLTVIPVLHWEIALPDLATKQNEKQKNTQTNKQTKTGHPTTFDKQYFSLSMSHAIFGAYIYEKDYLLFVWNSNISGCFILYSGSVPSTWRSILWIHFENSRIPPKVKLFCD